MELKELILKYVVKNALKYGKADEKAVMRKIMAENPELRKIAKEVLKEVKKVVDEFNTLNKDEREKIIQLYNFENETKEIKKGLPPLPKAVVGKVVMRFAPNPNGPPTLGSARGIVVNSEYAKIYRGKFILRFDDTDPRTKKPMLEAYEWYIEDCEWLDAKPDEVVYASKRIDLYYDYAKDLIEMGNAYVCFCRRDEFKNYRDKGIDCPHRDVDVNYSLEAWEKMLEGNYEEGEAVLRIKTDMKHKDPAVRDWVAFRIIYEEHPLVGDKYHVYPTLDFESAIEDHLLGITHILRGKDLADSEKRQKYIYKYFGWEYPVVKLWGKISIHEFGKLSTSLIKEEIERRKYKGWDDPKLPTLKAFRRRGFEPKVIREFFLSFGVGENDVNISLKNLYAENRKVIDKKANRYFYVWDPVEIRINGIEKREIEIPIHPDKRGLRKLKGEDRIYITKDDFERFKGNVVRLKEFCTIKLDYKAELIGYDYNVEGVKKGKNIIHWLPKTQSLKCIVYGIEKDYEGFVEDAVVNEVGNVVQFERFAFCKVEKVNEIVEAVYTHP